MRIRLLALVFSVVMAFAAATVQAKGPADKITIAGPGLTNAVEITEPQALDEFSPWAGLFMDESRGTVSPPLAPRVYAVSIEVKPQWLYRFDYVPDPAGGPGYIYLPGPGDPRYSRNTGTIIRDVDGQWLYSSRDWGRLLQGVIARATPEPKTLPVTGTGSRPDAFWAILLAVVALAVGAVLRRHAQSD